jgi:hypothetical protein
MIGSLLYLMITRPDIQFIVCLCERFQAIPRFSHRTAVQGIFRYLKHTHSSLGFSILLLLHWILLVLPMLIVGCGIDRKRTSGTCHFLRSSLVC